MLVTSWVDDEEGAQQSYSLLGWNPTPQLPLFGP